VEQEQKDIYNIYLRVLGEAAGRPYSYRKNFDDMGVDVQGYLARLSEFFRNYPHIDKGMYFLAPFKIWREEKHYPLAFFCKRKSLTAYTAYKKHLTFLDPDDIYHLNYIITSYKFIKRYSAINNLKVSDYINHVDGTHVFLTHLKEGKVSIYALFGFDSFKQIFRSTDTELRRSLYGDLYSDYDTMYRKYIHSNKCRELTQKALQKVS
jgi:hypothetical protein|tara:strand:- start:54761 stop:55384 length:624 start_codon:yes stop_codon:yes gene_type:complete